MSKTHLYHIHFNFGGLDRFHINWIQLKYLLEKALKLFGISTILKENELCNKVMENESKNMKLEYLISNIQINVD